MNRLWQVPQYPVYVTGVPKFVTLTRLASGVVTATQLTSHHQAAASPYPTTASKSPATAAPHSYTTNPPQDGPSPTTPPLPAATKPTHFQFDTGIDYFWVSKPVKTGVISSTLAVTINGICSNATKPSTRSSDIKRNSYWPQGRSVPCSLIELFVCLLVWWADTAKWGNLTSWEHKPRLWRTLKPQHR